SRGRFRAGVRLLQVDRDPTAFGRFQWVDEAILADAAEFASAVADQLARRRGHEGSASSSIRVPVTASESEPLPSAGAEGLLDPAAAGAEGLLDPAAVCARLNELLPEDRVVVVDGGHICMWATQLIDVHRPRSFTHGFSFGSIAQSLALSIGAAAGAEGRKVVSVMGDGAAAMSIAELETAVRYQLPLVAVVLSDGGFGIERHSLRFEGLP